MIGTLQVVIANYRQVSMPAYQKTIVSKQPFIREEKTAKTYFKKQDYTNIGNKMGGLGNGSQRVRAQIGLTHQRFVVH